MRRLHLNLDLTGVIVILAAGVLLPVLLATAAGIVALVIARDAGGIVTGVLVISFAVTAMGSALVTVVLAGRKTRLARLQADFVASVSHEFRTPLSSIRLYAQTLQSGKLAGDPERTAQCLAVIVRETEWLNALVERVLTWRSSSRDLVELAFETQPVTQAVLEAADRFRAMVAPDGLEFAASADSRRRVRHDAHAVASVLLNLLTNAYKYTGPAKQIRIVVRDEAQHVAIEVRDNGIGMSRSEMRHIFQPFYRAAHPDGRDRGVGLGLAVARYLVDRHGGTIEVGSEKGKGSVFTVRLPALPANP
jgi:two-component system phosphate regulon sensor histidine kinase PhoR